MMIQINESAFVNVEAIDAIEFMDNGVFVIANNREYHISEPVRDKIQMINEYHQEEERNKQRFGG